MRRESRRRAMGGVVGVRVWLLASVLVVGSVVGLSTAQADNREEEIQKQEYQIKAAFIFNFLKFIEWPGEGKPQEQPQGNPQESGKARTIRIGMLGPKVAWESCSLLAGKEVRGRKVELVQVSPAMLWGKEKETENERKEREKSLAELNVIYLCEGTLSNRKAGEREETLAWLGMRGVLTIGEESRFLESGGMLNFVLKDRKVHFEINLVALERAKLVAKSQLLKLALRVIQPEKRQ